MSGFSLPVRFSNADSEAQELITRIERGEKYERSVALKRLIERAEASGTADDWNLAGIGYHLSGFKSQALDIFDALVKDFPQGDVYRVNLASACAMAGQIAMCRHHLRYLVEHASDDDNCQLGRELLGGYEKFVGVDTEGERLRTLQRAVLRHRVVSKSASESDYLALGRLLIRDNLVSGDPEPMNEAIDCLEQGAVEYPKGASVLELLVLCYLRHDTKGRLDATVRRLEAVAPHSEALRALQESGREMDEEAIEQARSPTHNLLSLANEGTEEERAAAVVELARLVGTSPYNSDYRSEYAFALLASNQSDAAREQIEILAACESMSHAFHFNLGQLLCMTGNWARGQAHLQLAVEYASDDEERSNAYERIAYFTEREHPREAPRG